MAWCIRSHLTNARRFFNIWLANHQNLNIQANFINFLEDLKSSSLPIVTLDIVVLVDIYLHLLLTKYLGSLKDAWGFTKICFDFYMLIVNTGAVYLNHGLRTPNEGINQRNLKLWADVADKICFGRT